MLNADLKLLIREKHISKIWVWLGRCGFLVGFSVLILLLEEGGITPPTRHYLSPQAIRWTERGLYAVSVLSVMASFSLGAGKRKRKFETQAKKMLPDRHGNPHAALSEEDILLLLEYLARIESLQWNAASIPALAGMIFYLFVGLPAWLLICLSISVVTYLIHRPSLERDETLIELSAGPSGE